MGIFDKLKFGKSAKTKPETKKALAKENVLDLVKDEKPAEEKKKPAVLKSATGEAFRYLQRPQLSEKGNFLSKQNQYVFRVSMEATKPEVRKAIEKVYDVKVVSVNIMNVRGKARRSGRVVGRTKAWKKAIITVAAGQRIEGVTETV